MDRSGSFEHDTDRHEFDTDYYRQSFGDYDFREEGDSSRQWGYIAAGALLMGLGSYLLFSGARSQSQQNYAGSGGLMGGMGQGRGLDRFTKGDRDNAGVQVREQVTVNRSVSELYRFWRNVENLPRVMTYLESVTRSGERRSHWVAKGPAGQRIEWDAEVTDARENELVAWRSLEGSEVPNEGSVRFSRSPDGNGTIIDVALTYHPPGGKAGAAVAKLFGREPAQEVRRDLERFKERVESGNLILASGSAGGPYSEI